MSTHQYHSHGLYNEDVPGPVIERDWFHSCSTTLSWDVDRIIQKIGDKMWLNRRSTDKDDMRMNHECLGGYWPTGGFVWVKMTSSDAIDDSPRANITAYAESSAQAEVTMNELIAEYQSKAAPTSGAKIGILSRSSWGLNAQRIYLSDKQTVQKDKLDTYYGEGAETWGDELMSSMTTRRYGLSILTGPPGTGKTTFLRSLASWLATTHIFYFISAGTFHEVKSGDFVEFVMRGSKNSSMRRVLILEDADVLLRTRGLDNQEKVSTLLNITDGILGDALGLHVICTLNGSMDELDPALVRPGRLVAHRNFRLLTSDEAMELSVHLGKEPPEGRGDVSLAEIFNRDTSEEIGALRKKIGF